MPLYTRKDFAAKCGVPVANVNVYVGRKKITLTGKLIDDSLPENDYFYQNCLRNKGTDQIEEVKDVPDAEPVMPAHNNFTKTSTFSQKETKKVESSAHFQLDHKLKQAELEKKEVDTRIAKLKEDKLKGRVLPTDLFKMVFSQHTKSIIHEFNNSVDKMLVRIVKKKNLTNEESAEIRKELIDEINRAVDASVDESKKTLKALLEEHSNKRGKGERI